MSYLYEVGPINYFDLSEPGWNAVLTGFATAPRQLSSPVVFHVKPDAASVFVGGEPRSAN